VRLQQLMLGLLLLLLHEHLLLYITALMLG
jgi:hypothetical protein